MKNIATKLSYMALGGLLTLIGYHYGNIDNNTANAQVAADEVKDVIRCRKLIIVGKGDGGFYGLNNRIVLETTDMDRGSISIYNEEGVLPRVSLGVANNVDTGFLKLSGLGNNRSGVELGVGTDGARMTLYNSQSDRAVELGAGTDGGIMLLYNKVRNSAVFKAGVTMDGRGYAVTLGIDGQQTDGIGPKGRVRAR